MGFIWGAVAAVAVTFVVMRRRRYRRFFRYAGFHHHHHRHDQDDYGVLFARGYRRRGRFLFGLFRKLDASPGQEKALIDLAERLREHMDQALPELRAARKEVAAAVGSELFDAGTLDAVFQQSAQLAEKLGHELREALHRVHELLDPEQRRLLAEWIADGSFGARFHRPYAHAC